MNKWHDEKGRFTHGPSGGKSWAKTHNSLTKEQQEEVLNKKYIKSERSKEEYERRKEVRQNKNLTYIVNKDGTYSLSKNKEIQEGMIVEYSPKWCGEGEEKYIHVVKECYTDEFGKKRALIHTLNSSVSFGLSERVDLEMIQPASKEKVDSISLKFKQKNM